MFGFDCLCVAELILVFNRPTVGRFIVRTASYSAAHLQFAAQRLHFFRAGFPHHARAAPGITERIDQRLNNFATVAVVTLRNQSVLDRAPERKSPDPLRRPVGGDFLAAHTPDFFGVALEECVEEAFAELITNPLFEIARVPHREESRFQPGKNAERRFEDAQLQ